MACKEVEKKMISIEKKEYSEGSCFGVDCLGSYYNIQNSVRLSIKTCDQFLQIIKARIQADEVYGKSLAKISSMQLQIFPGTLFDCLEQFKADINHKSAQHLLLADTVNNDIYLPILELRNHLETKEKEITAQYLKMQQEMKNLEDIYKKRIYTYEKCYRDAFNAIESLKKHEKEKQTLTQRVSNEPTSQSSQPTQTNNLIASIATSLTPSITSLAGKTKSNEILQWVVSASTSTTTPIVQNSNDLQQNVSNKISKAERQRLLARKSWIEYIITCQRYSLKAQILLTKLQGQLESVIVILQDHMRKMIVFESSSLANQQYDIQMLFKAMERIDVRGDMLGLIDTHRNTLTDKEFPWVSNIFSDIHLSHFSELPLPPSNKPLTNNLTSQPIWLDRNTTNEFSKMILLQRYPEVSEDQIILENIQGLGVYDGLNSTTTTTNNNNNNITNDNLQEQQDSNGENEEKDEKEEGEWYECAEDTLSKLVALQNHTRQYWLDIIENFNCDVPSQENNITLSSPKSIEVTNDEKLDSDDDQLISQNSNDDNNNDNSNHNQNHLYDHLEFESNINIKNINNFDSTLINQNNEVDDLSSFLQVNFNSDDNNIIDDSNNNNNIIDNNNNNNTKEMVIKTENIINSWGLLDAVFNDDENTLSNYPIELNSNQAIYSNNLLSQNNEYFPSEVLSNQNHNELLLLQENNTFPTRHVSLL